MMLKEALLSQKPPSIPVFLPPLEGEIDLLNETVIMAFLTEKPGKKQIWNEEYP